MKVLIVVALMIAAAVVLSWKGSNCCSTNCSVAPAPVTQPGASQSTATSKPAGPLPRLVDLGADKCIPCKRMAPILEELRKEYAGRLQVEFYDVWKNPSVKEKYGIRAIPTQIFISSDGKELYRHEGFISKEDILGWWKEFGVTLEP